MKQHLIALAAASLFATSAFASHFSADPAHSNVDFTIRHLVSNVRGSFSKFEGTFDFDEAKGEGIENLKFSVDTESVNTGNEKRDNHLRSPDFFDAKKYPKIDFVERKATKNGDKKFTLEGDLTLHGVTKPVSWDVEFLGTGPNPMGGVNVGFTATTKVKRSDFGITWNKTMDTGSLMLGDEVALSVNIEAPKGDAAKAAAEKKAIVKKEMKPSDVKKKK